MDQDTEDGACVVSIASPGTQQLQGSQLRRSVKEKTPPEPIVKIQQTLLGRRPRKPSHLTRRDTEMQGLLVSGLDAGVDSFNTFGLGKTAIAFSSEESPASFTPSTEELLGIQQGLKGGSFMPFVSEDRSRDYKQLAAQSVFPKCPVLEALQGCSEESLVGLLCDFSFDGKHPDEWMKALEHFLWGSDVLPETDFKQEHLALCLKETVWNAFNLNEDQLPAQSALFWILNRSFHDDVLIPFSALGPAGSDASFTSQRQFNIFSFRALFGAVLHTNGKEATKAVLQGFFPIHIAAENLFPDAVYYLLSWGVHVNQRTLFAGKTALHHVVRFQPVDDAERVRQKTLLEVLNTFHASHNVQDVGGNVPLFNAILTEDVELIKLLIDSAPINHADADGDTHLHVAVEVNSADIVGLLIKKGADPRAVNKEGQTPSHLAAKNPLACLKVMNEESKKQHQELISTFNHEDAMGNTPLDYAALHSQKETFEYIWNCMQEDPSLSIAPYKVVLRRWLQKVHRSEVQTVLLNLQSTLKIIPKPAIQSIVAVQNVPGTSTEEHQLSLYSLLQKPEEISIPAVTTILDKCLYGGRVVIAKVLESDRVGRYPPMDQDEHSVVLRQMVTSLDTIWFHPTLKIWVNNKWSHFGQWFMLVFFLLYSLQMLVLTTALSLAARPGVTDETLNLYNTPLDQFRGFVEAVVIFTWMIKIANELQKIIVLKPKIYLRDAFSWLNLFAIFFLFLTAILRASGSSSQWVLAALAYIAYSSLALEYLSLMRWSSTYVQTLFIILRRDLSKFLAIYLVFLIGFSGAFFLALQVDRPSGSGTAVGGTNSTSSSGGTNNSSTFIWDAFYIGIRVVAESQGVVNYDGRLGWLAVLFYLCFLLMTLVVMLNLLIAQMSDTYAKVQLNARALATFRRARFMVRYLFLLGHLHARRKRDSNSKLIIWSDDSSLGGTGNGVLRKVVKLMKSSVSSVFLADRIALQDEEDDSSLNIKDKDTLTTYDMHLMLGKLKKSIKNDMNGLRQEVRSLRSPHTAGTPASAKYRQ